jgi:hypothetical protein
MPVLNLHTGVQHMLSPLLMPSQNFLSTQNYTELAQTIFAAPSWGPRIVFALSSKAASKLFTLSSISHLFFIPSNLMYKASKNPNGTTDTVFLKKHSWIAPVAGMLIYSLIAYKLYALPSSFLVKGAIAGIHSAALLVLSCSPFHQHSRIISLTSDLKNRAIFCVDSHGLSEEVIKNLHHRSELVACAVFAVSNIAITCLSQNPILGNAIAYPLAAITKVATTRLLGEISLRHTY